MKPGELFGILEETAVYVTEIFNKQMPPQRYFHGLSHTMNVVHHAEVLSKRGDVPLEEQTLLLIAAWFHDVGYISGSDHHEQQSAEIAEKFLSDSDFNVSQRDLLKGLILSTRYPANPKSNLEKIICDADIQHLGSKLYPNWSLLLKRETEFFSGKEISDKDWRMGNKLFFEAHPYFTKEAVHLWGEQRSKNYHDLGVTAL